MQSQDNAVKEGFTPDLAKEKNKGLTVTLHIGDVQIDTLTTEQRKRMSERLSKTMNTYYSLHPTEYEQFNV